MCVTEQVAAMPRLELAALWQQYLHAFAALLLQMRGNIQSDAGRRLLCACMHVMMPVHQHAVSG